MLLKKKINFKQVISLNLFRPIKIVFIKKVYYILQIWQTVLFYQNKWSIRVYVAFSK